VFVDEDHWGVSPAAWGWINYFRLSSCQIALKNWNGWIRRKRAPNVINGGPCRNHLQSKRSRITAGTIEREGPTFRPDSGTEAAWWNSGHASHHALPNVLPSNNLVSTSRDTHKPTSQYQRFQGLSRTAVCRPARPVLRGCAVRRTKSGDLR